MTEYSFVLKYRLGANECDPDELVERLGAAGCTDALVGIGKAGHVALDFTRDSNSAKEAVHSALEEVKAAIPSATLVHASPDLVGLTDIADRVGVSRQSMRKLMMANRDFPAPVYDGSIALWHLADVLAWLGARRNYAPETSLVDVARAVLAVNAAREGARCSPDEKRRLAPLLA